MPVLKSGMGSDAAGATPFPACRNVFKALAKMCDSDLQIGAIVNAQTQRATSTAVVVRLSSGTKNPHFAPSFYKTHMISNSFVLQ